MKTLTIISIYSILLLEIPHFVMTQGCLKYKCADLSENDITDAADSIPFCVYKTDINPAQILIDSTICAKSKPPPMPQNSNLTSLEFPLQ